MGSDKFQIQIDKSPISHKTYRICNVTTNLNCNVGTALIQEGRYRGPLHGVPISFKDLTATAGGRSTSASVKVVDMDRRLVAFKDETTGGATGVARPAGAPGPK